jgi:WD40 repeat protein
VREARAAAAVTHDNVIAIYAVEDAGPVPYLVMQLIDGCTLQQKLDRTGRLPVEEVVRIGAQTAAGLAAAHAQGLVHRDVKPANILLESKSQESGVRGQGSEGRAAASLAPDPCPLIPGRVKITDFGVARAVDDASLTQSGFVTGTPAYMSPEQANGAKVDPRNDLFSLGSVLYTLCAGHPPFRAGTPLAVLKRICEDTPRPLHEINPDVPDWLEAMIARLHAKDPSARFQTASEVAEALTRHLEQPDTVGHVFTVPGKRARWKRVARVAAFVALGAAILGASVAVHQVLQGSDEPGAPDGANNAKRDTAKPKPPPPPPEKWTTLRSPLDDLKREAMQLPDNMPPEVLALLGDSPRFRLPELGNAHWMAQTGDGRLLAVPCGAKILLYEAETGKLLRTLTGHTSQAHRPAFSPDGKHLAAGSEKSGLRVWDVASGKEEIARNEPGHVVWAVAYDSEGKRLISADAAGTIKVWDARGQRLTSFAGHDKGVNQLAFSSDGKRLATASLDGTCKIWDTDKWKQIRSLSAKGKTFEAVAWSRDGKLLAAGDDAQVVIWNADTYDVLHTLPTPGKGLLAFTPDARTLLTAQHANTKGEKSSFKRWDVKKGTEQKTCQQFTFNGFDFFHLSPDGKMVYALHNPPVNTHVLALDAEGCLLQPPAQGHGSWVECVAFSPDGRFLASGSHDWTVRIWNLAGWKAGEPQPPCGGFLVTADTVFSLAFSPDGTLLAAASGSTGRLCLWDVARSRMLHNLAGHVRRGSALAFTPDGRTLAAGSGGRLNLWDVKTGKREESPVWNDGPVFTVAFSSDGRLLACGDTKTIQVIDRVAGRRLHAFRGERMFTNLAFSPDGKILAGTTAGIDPQLRLWDMATGEEQAARATPGFSLIGLSFHPGGRLVATTTFLHDPKVHLWDVTPSGKEVRAYEFAGRQPRRLAFSPEGRYLAVGLHDGAIAIVRVAP